MRPFPLLAVVLSRVDLPYLVMGRPEFRCNICWMDVNHKQAGQLAANYILDRGYRRLAFVIGSLDDPLAQSRFAGIRQVMKEEELPVAVLSSGTPYTLDAGCSERLLAKRDSPEVLVCNNNHLALQCLQQVRRLGLAIPTQIALITFDNYPFSMLTELAITAVDLDMHEMGINAVRFILQRVLKPNLLTQSYCTLPAILEQGAT